MASVASIPRSAQHFPGYPAYLGPNFKATVVGASRPYLQAPPKRRFGEQKFQSIDEAEQFFKKLGFENVQLKFPGASFDREILKKNLACANYLANGLVRYFNKGWALPLKISVLPATQQGAYCGLRLSDQGYFGAHETLEINPDYLWERIESVQRDNFRAGLFSSDHPYYLIDHEMGHFYHGFITPNLMDKCNTECPGQLIKKEPALAAFIDKKVGNYASINYADFVADAFSGMMGGKIYPRGIMELFEKWGGKTLGSIVKRMLE